MCANFGKTILSLTNAANLPGPGLSAGQKMADGQLGTIKEPLALQQDICLRTGTIRDTGGQIQLVRLTSFE